MPETSREALLAYLRQHAPQHGVDALRDHLLQRGYDPSIVEDAVDAYHDGEGRKFERSCLGCVGAVILGTASCSLFLLGICSGGADRSYAWPFYAGALVAAIVAVAVVLASLRRR